MGRETLRGRVKIILEIISRIIFVCKKSALTFLFQTFHRYSSCAVQSRPFYKLLFKQLLDIQGRHRLVKI